MGVLLKILGWIVGLFAPKAPPPAERAAAAETKVEAMEASNVAVQNAIDARDAVVERRVRAGVEADARAPDPNSRD